ncbi:N-6 DNA methylase [Pseudomaricurvus alcaniphilus]|uniref:Eco57I restriction-modification methylase domain-containing protein n=1 Tax=Pseudomaricurvus alcaniphilus TaxID=1166482 RepID=UPI00140B4504|nr:TaqI-like C-terminal specificity domain-containing protein [Pseudomaricurvus alcaniphilus]NHN38947.1 N-6 DNA methylase [Pseudomaricurvus alcaniphilus]
MPAPESVKLLVETFDNNFDFYKSSQYNEAQLRQEFLDPFFRELGWDMDNSSGLAPQYRDVIHEASIKIGGSTKAPDYAFTIHGQYKFFLEAKKPSVDVQLDPEPAYQLRRYGWSAKLPISILTDFEEFAVYDCRKRPKRGERASTARLNFFKYTDYLDKWEELYSTFSKEAILKGSFDKYATDSKRHRGSETVDDAFLVEIENWRSLLAKNLALRNPNLSARDLNFSVQKTIDRLIFLRICEDRGTEDYKRLASILNGKGVYARLLDIFRLADSRYNSGLFHFSNEKGRVNPDTITPNLNLDDKILRDIISKLYYPDSPYEFSVLPADILGQVYERFLGKAIHLTASHKAKIEEKPEVRKAGGVYYTPSYIVQYIVQNTLGRLLDGGNSKPLKPLSISKAASLKVLDPACGSGSFLIEAYQYLLDWHLRQYTVNLESEELDTRKIKKHSSGRNQKIYKSPGGEWKLTTDERKRILLNNIFGVDIDSQAVEVTKLSLLLKVIEGETQQVLQKDWILERQRILPDLEKNIKCGNSLIGPEFYNNDEMILLDEEAQFRINVFNWQLAFEDIIKSGGFNCVIGNPPYVFGRDWNQLGISPDEKRFFIENYSWSPYQLDMFSLFMEQCSRLTKEAGMIGQIVPNIWLTNTFSSLTRNKILTTSKDLIISDPPRDVFAKITVDTVIYTYQKSSKIGDELEIRSLNSDGSYRQTSITSVEEYLSGERPISLNLSEKEAEIVYRLSEIPTKLGHLADITRGVHSYRTGGYGKSAFGTGPQTKKDCEERPYHSEGISPGYRPFIYGKDLRRFGPLEPKEFIMYGNWLAEPRAPEFFQGKRIYSRKILAKRLVVTIEDGDSVADQQVYITKLKNDASLQPEFVCGVLASKLIAFFIYGYYDESLDSFPQIKVGQLKNIPIKSVDFNNPEEKVNHDKLVRLVARIQELNRKKLTEKNPNSLELIENQISALDSQIDNLVYTIYQLTPSEISVIEQG